MVNIMTFVMIYEDKCHQLPFSKIKFKDSDDFENPSLSFYFYNDKVERQLHCLHETYSAKLNVIVGRWWWYEAITRTSLSSWHYFLRGKL